MKSKGRMLAAVAVFAMVAAAFVCVLPMSDDIEADAADTSDFDISVGQTKVSTISVNDNAFEFVDQSKDGIVVSYSNGVTTGELAKYSYISDWTWTNPDAVDLGSYTLDLENKSNIPNGQYNLIFKGESASTDVSELTITITVTSHGAAQTLTYKYDIEVFDVVTAISYAKGSGTIGGSFSAEVASVTLGKDTLTFSPESKDEENKLANYVFYANGLNPGVALLSDLSISGSVPEDKRGWDSSSMELTFAVTDVRTGYVTIITDVDVYFELTDGPVLDYRVAYVPAGSSVVTDWTQGNGNVKATVVSGGILSITGSSDCVATIVYQMDGSTIENRIELSKDKAQEIDISGTGVLYITVSVVGSVEQTLKITVVDDLIPINDIKVSCGPADNNP